MKWCVIALVVAALAGVPAYFVLSGGDDFGVSAANKLGDFKTIEKWMAEKKFKKVVKPQLRVFEHVLEIDEIHELRDMDVRQYKDTATSSYRGAVHRLTFIMDGDRIKILSCEFYTGAKALGIPLSRTETFCQQFWKQVTGVDAKFTPSEEGEGVSIQMFLDAYANKRGVRARWRKMYVANLKESSIVDDVTFFLE